MRIPLIKIIDNNGGYIHRIGSDIHDVLYIDQENGTLSYSNLQNGCGSRKFDKKHKPEYRFDYVNAPIDEYEPIVEFVSLQRFIKIIVKEWLDDIDNRRKLKKYIKIKNRRKRK